jgi:hypothetical protein
MRPVLKLPENYQSLPPGKLLDMKLRMEERVDMINGQIDEADQMDLIPASGFGSKLWHSRAARARNAYTRDIQRLTLALESQPEQKTTFPAEPGMLADIFMTVARRRLDEVVYKSILHEAQEEL